MEGTRFEAGEVCVVSGAGAGGAVAARPATQQAGGGSTPTPALQSLRVVPVPCRVLKPLLLRHHYLHSLPGGTNLAFGVFASERLLGAVTLGSGPSHAFELVEAATADDCLALTRLWLSDDLPSNGESRVLGVVLRALRRHTGVKFLVTYADPSMGHAGTVYQATGWLYTGLSKAMPFYDLGDGRLRHSRSLSHAYGSHALRHFREHGVEIQLVPQAPKHRYLHFLDPSWRARLKVAVLAYPKRGEASRARR